MNDQQVPIHNGGDGQPVRPVSIFEVVNLLLRQWRPLIFVPLLIVGGVVLQTLRQPRTYTATASFVPQGTESPGEGISGLAAQLGVSFGGGQRAHSPEFYADLVRSPQILREVVQTPLTVATSSGAATRTLIELMKVQAPSREASVELATRGLRDRLSVRTSRETGVVTVAVSMTEPDVAQATVQTLLILVNRFDQQQRRSQVAEERRFVQERLAVLRDELGAAEAQLRTFLNRNRQWQGSPDLMFEKDRLEQNLLLRQQLVASLAQAYEKARIDEVRTTPATTVIEQPRAPAFPDGRGLMKKGTLALVLGSGLGLLAALVQESLRRAWARRETGVDEFIATRDSVVARLRPGRHAKGAPRGP
jgi:uncharacterized protein involved in exopolysaccharide biosynthesis